MRSDHRLATIGAIAAEARLVNTIAPTIVPDLLATIGTTGQQRPQRVTLADDIRDLDPVSLEERPRPAEDTGPRIADPTGEAGIRDDPASTDLAELDKRLARARGDLAVAVKILARHQTARTPTQIRNLRQAADHELDDLGDDWCKSHLQIHVLQPIDVRKTGDNAGRPYYVGMCRWCGENLSRLKRDHPKRFRSYRLMPIELVGAAHARKGHQLRQSDVDALLGPQHRAPRGRDRRPRGEDRQRTG